MLCGSRPFTGDRARTAEIMVYKVAFDCVFDRSRLVTQSLRNLGAALGLVTDAG